MVSGTESVTPLDGVTGLTDGNIKKPTATTVICEYKGTGVSLAGSRNMSITNTASNITATLDKTVNVGTLTLDTVSKDTSLTPDKALTYDFSKVKSIGDSHGIRSSDIKGASGMLELGIELKSPESPWELDIGAKAYTGQHQGFSGNLGIKYLF